MPTKKKQKGTAAAAAKKEKRLEDAAAAKEAKETRDMIEEATKTKQFTNAQLSGLLSVCVAFTYLVDYYRAIHKGLEATGCSEWVPTVDACSETDLWMVQAKFNSGVLALLSVVATMIFVCWHQEELFLRLNSLLCSAPLITTLMAVHVVRDMCNPNLLFKLSFMCTLLLAVTAGNIYSATSIATIRTPRFNLPEATLLTLVVAFGWETYKMFIGGVPSYLAVEKDQVGTPAHALAVFVTVDYATMTGLLIFGLLFTNESQQRVMLSALAFLLGVVYYTMFPSVRDHLADPAYYESFLSGTSIFALSAAFLPSPNLLGKTTEPESNPNGSTDATATSDTPAVNGNKKG